MRTALRTLFFTLPLCACSALGSSEPAPSWQSAVVESPSDRVLWKITLLSVERMGFPLASGLDPSSGIVTTGWKTNLQPFSGDGTRARAEVRIEAEGPRQWRVRAHVQKQVNKSLVAPLDPTRAEWEWVPDDSTQTSILLRHIVAAFEPDLEVRGTRSP
jgi:hypothetical protein